MNPDGFKRHGSTKVCSGCVSLRDGMMVRARRNHSEACRNRMEDLIGGDRVRRAVAGREQELDERLQQEDARIAAASANLRPPSAPRSCATSDVVEDGPIRASETRGLEDRQGTATWRHTTAGVGSRTTARGTPQSDDVWSPGPKRFRGPPRGAMQAEYTEWMKANREPMSQGPNHPAPEDGGASGSDSIREDFLILSAIIRGVDIMEILPPPRVTDA